MTDEMKLLKALCEALGFLVYVDADYQEIREPNYIYQDNLSKVNRVLKTDLNGKWIRDEEGSYTSTLIDPITTYKLIKKEDIKGELVK